MTLKEVLEVLPKSTLINVTDIAYFKSGEYYSFCTRFNGSVEEFFKQIDENDEAYTQEVIALNPRTLYHDDEHRIGPEIGISIDVKTILGITKEVYERSKNAPETCPG